MITPRKLMTAIRRGMERLAPVRKSRLSGIREYAGSYYYADPDSKPEQRRIMNLVARGMNVLVPNLAMHNPEAEVKTNRMMLRGEALKRGLLLDHASQDMDRVLISRRVLLNALLSPVGIRRIGIRTGDELVKVQGRFYERGGLYDLDIDLDDYVCDPDARRPDEFYFEGHRFLTAREELADCGLFNPDVIMSLPEWNAGDSEYGPRAEMLTKREGGDDPERLVEQVALWNIALYAEGRTLEVTMPCDESFDDDFLRIKEWEGPDKGPYSRLEFYPMPAQAFGLPWVEIMREQAQTLNNVLGRMVDQIMRTKRNLVGKRGQGDDLETVAQAADGETLEVDDPESIKEFGVGNVAPDFAPFATLLIGWSNQQFMNMDVLGGEGGGTDKATIYQGMQAAANIILEDMQETFRKHEGDCLKRMGFFLDGDPFLNRTMTTRLPGGEYIEVVYDAQAKKGTFADFNYKVQALSMGRKDPAQRTRDLVQFATVVPPEMMNWQSYARVMGREMRIPELDELILDPMVQMQNEQAAMGAGMPGQGVPAGPSQVRPGTGRERMLPAGKGANGGAPQGPRAGRPQPAGAY